MRKVILLLLPFICACNGLFHGHKEKISVVFHWKQLTYDFDGVLYLNDSNTDRTANSTVFTNESENLGQYFTQYNNVPIGMEVFGDRVFVTVPRRRYGIPSTLNYITLSNEEPSSPSLKPYPSVEAAKSLVSIYRPRVDRCGRLWMVDTGHLEVPGDREQLVPPAIIIYDLKTDELVLKHDFDPSILVNEKTSAGLTSITVEVDPESCEDAFAYINDLATEGLVVFSLKTKESWRIKDRSFAHDDSAMNFTAAGYVINWKDGLFSLALSDPDDDGKRRLFYHPLVSTQEYAIDTAILKTKRGSLDMIQTLGSRGSDSQSGSHAYHGPTKTLIFANVAQDGIQCWNTNTQLSQENVATIAQDHQKLAYISDLKIVGDDVWVLTNQIPRFIYSSYDKNEYNFFIQRGNIRELIRGTVCDSV